MATENGDFIVFTGTMQHITTTLTNPYSSKSYNIDDEFNVNNTTYDGLGGFDILFMSSFGDSLNLTNNVGVQVITNIERIVAGNGGDVINLADSNITYGDIVIQGGAGDDILWANVGNDCIQGSNGNDILDGGPGHDILEGNSDNDQIFGGLGNDHLIGGTGDDILYGGTDLGLLELDKDFVDNITFPDLQSGVNITNLIPPGTPSLGINADNLTVSYDASATLTFRHGVAGYKNTLGMYKINENGTIESAEILWGNVKTAGINQSYSIDLPVGADGGQFGFFIVANGFNKNGGYSGLDITGDDVISFIYDFGGAGERAATINDNGNMISTVYDDGTTVKVLSGYTYHTTDRGASADLNWDGETHAVSGLGSADNQDVLRIGFEDLPNLGDADYEDVLFDLDIDRVHVDASEQGADILIGGAGNDILYGEGGDDILVIGNGFDQAYGGTGSDTFAFDVGDTLVDKIFDFETGIGGDIINVSDVLRGYDPLSDAINDFVSLVQNGDDTELHLNADGTGAAIDFFAIATFEGGIDGTLTDLINNGNFVADNAVIV